MEKNQVDINLSTDIKTDNLVPLNITLMSRDINNNSFLLKFKSNGSDVQLNNSFTVEILSVFPNSKIEILTQATVYGNTAMWEFDTKYITRNEVVSNYVYVKKDGVPIISADANAFTFSVGLSKIDGNAGKTAESYDRNYEKVLHEFEARVTMSVEEIEAVAVNEPQRQANEQTRKTNESGRVTAEDVRKANEVARISSESNRELLFDKVENAVIANATNIIRNGNFANGTVNWRVNGGETISVFDTQLNRYVLQVRGVSTSYPGMRQITQDTVGHKMYVSFLGKVVVGEPTGTLRPYVGFGVNGGVYFDSKEYTRHSFIHNSAMEMFYLLGGNSAGVDTTVRFADVVAIDLTKVFGSGNEPTKEYMDRLLSQFENAWFDGTKNIFSAKQSLVELSKLHSDKANRKQSDWITPTLLNGMTGTIKYRRNEFNRLEFKGTLSGAFGTLAMSLPIGYRVQVDTNVLVPRTDATGYRSVLLSATGGVTLNLPTGDFMVSLSNISLPLE